MCLLYFSVCIANAESRNLFLLREPSISLTQVAFSFGGTIWVANRDGTQLQRLTNGPHDRSPVFSPDGSQIAYTRDFDEDAGTGTVCIMPSRGGISRRLTFHPADIRAVGWTPDGGQVLFESARFGIAAWQAKNSQLFTVSAAGGMSKPLPLPRSSQGSFSPDGSRLAYVPNVQWLYSQDAWKHYRGGNTQRIWIARLSDSSVEKISENTSNDFNPMWIGNKVYFLSDRSGRVTLFKYDADSRHVEKVLPSGEFDIKSASATSDAIVYDAFGSLHLLDLKSSIDRTLDIRPTLAQIDIQPKHVKASRLPIQYADVSPNGKNAAFGVRGEVLVAGLKERESYDLTQTSGVVERDPAWSPDGKAIAYFSDESGEYALHIRELTAKPKTRKISLGDPPSFYYTPTWSPDSKKIAYTDKRLNYWYVDVETGTRTQIDTDMYLDISQVRQLVWSPDSEWIAYTKLLENYQHAVFMYSLKSLKGYKLTDGMSDALYPIFDRTGKQLFFTASTDVAMSSERMAMNSLVGLPTRSVYAFRLNIEDPSSQGSGIERAIFPALRNHSDCSLKSASKAAPRCRFVPEEKRDLDGVSRGAYSVDVPARNYFGMFSGPPGKLLLFEGPAVHPFRLSAEKAFGKVYLFDVNSHSLEEFLSDVSFIQVGRTYIPQLHVSSNGRNVLFESHGQWYIAPVRSSIKRAAMPRFAVRLKLDSTEIYVNPPTEWRHMYQQVWRNERDFFYDPGLHGLSLDEAIKRYEPYLENLPSRDDLNYLFREMLGNLSVGHMFVYGGDKSPTRRSDVGLLGADFSVEEGRYRFERVYEGDTWDPTVRAPLHEVGIDIRPGEYLLAVNGRAVRTSGDLYSFFLGTSGKRTTLTVASRVNGSDARSISVVPVSSETELRHYGWVQDNRRVVDQLTGGRVAYIYLPDTSVGGFDSFNRDYFAQSGKEAAIIDERYNTGGLIADYVIEKLRRPLMNYWSTRDGRDLTNPIGAIFGPKVMLINEMAGSGGDALPWMFRKLDIGPLVGTRTWGGLVSVAFSPDDLLDGGTVTTPFPAFYNTRGAWDIENFGVAPDVEVDDIPMIARLGGDSQLEKAIDLVLDLLKKNTHYLPPARPFYPRYQ